MKATKKVVYLYIPTSNHNGEYGSNSLRPLYIFIFLHQTTTDVKEKYNLISCISLYSYIKPQRIILLIIILSVVYLYIPTSNHNRERLKHSI